MTEAFLWADRPTRNATTIAATLCGCLRAQIFRSAPRELSFTIFEEGASALRLRTYVLIRFLIWKSPRFVMMRRRVVRCRIVLLLCHVILGASALVMVATHRLFLLASA